jgi:starch phosphorylase
MKLRHLSSTRVPMGDSVRTGPSPEELMQAFLENLRCGLGRPLTIATKHDIYVALALTVRDRLFQQGIESMAHYGGKKARRWPISSSNFYLALIFSSDLSIRDYRERVWKIAPNPA